MRRFRLVSMVVMFALPVFAASDRPQFFSPDVDLDSNRVQGRTDPFVLLRSEFTIPIAGVDHVFHPASEVDWRTDGMTVRSNVDNNPDQFAVFTMVGVQVSGLIFITQGVFEIFPNDQGGYSLSQVGSKVNCLTLTGQPQAQKVTVVEAVVFGGRRRSVLPPVLKQYLFYINQWYTPEMLVKLGSLDAVKLKIQAKVDYTNTVFARSGLSNIKFATRNVYQYDGGGEVGQGDASAGALGMFASNALVNQKRDADQVHFAVLWHETGNSLTWRPVGNFDRKLGFILAVEGGTNDLPHELVHCFDGDHDQTHSLTGEGCRVPCTIVDPFPYGRGHIDAEAQFGDIMVYFTDADCPGFCSSAPLISSSDPILLWKGRPTGTPMEDNARVVREHAEKVYAYSKP